MIFDTLKAILLMGNIMFENGETATVTEASKDLVTESANLLGLSPSELENSFLSKRLEIRGEKMNVTLSESGASDTRNAFCKEIYGRLFCQITHQANKSLSVGDDFIGPDDPLPLNSANNLCIGLLDIFGFEIFTKNSFEQLCINYGNEKLQQYFIDYVLKKEQEIYLSEGLEFDQINHLDNEDVLSMIESRQGGIFALLDEELKLPKCTDLTFLGKVEKEHNNKPNGRFKRDFRKKAELFEIRHFAGAVTYDVSNFLEKNRDKMHDYLEDLIQSSSRLRFAETMVLHGPRAVLPGSSAPVTSPTKPFGRSSLTGSSAQSTTIVSRFSKQLNDLMVLLGMSEPHFVKCIKPNNSKKPEELDIELTLRQLRYSGVLEVRILIFCALRVRNQLHLLFFFIIRLLKFERMVTLCDYLIANLSGCIGCFLASRNLFCSPCLILKRAGRFSMP
jgi:myosin-5